MSNPQTIATQIKEQAEKYNLSLSEAAGNFFASMLSNADIGFYLTGSENPIREKAFLGQIMRTLLTLYGEKEIEEIFKKEKNNE